jgi:hypothetical protein
MIVCARKISRDDESKKKLTLGRRENFNDKHEKLVFYSIRRLVKFPPSASHDDR